LSNYLIHWKFVARSETTQLLLQMAGCPQMVLLTVHLLSFIFFYIELMHDMPYENKSEVSNIIFINDILL
jgi:hypothetical protein